MKGLIIKDLINLKKSVGIMVIFVVFYIVLSLTSGNGTMFEGVLSVVCAILPITAMGYDEKARWDKYALSMPVSRNDMVLGKYLLGVILSVTAFVINIIFNMIIGPGTFVYGLLVSLALFAVGILFISVIFPFTFKYGVEKGRLIMMLALFVPTAAIVVFAKLGIKAPGEEALNRLALAAPFVVILILALSILASVRIYAVKEM